MKIFEFGLINHQSVSLCYWCPALLPTLSSIHSGELVCVPPTFQLSIIIIQMCEMFCARWVKLADNINNESMEIRKCRKINWNPFICKNKLCSLAFDEHTNDARLVIVKFLYIYRDSTPQQILIRVQLCNCCRLQWIYLHMNVCSSSSVQASAHGQIAIDIFHSAFFRSFTRQPINCSIA